MAEKIRHALASAKGYTTRKDVQLPNLPIRGEAQTPEEDQVVYIRWHFSLCFESWSYSIMKVKTPMVRLGATYVQNLNFVPTNLSFDTTFATQNRVKNTYWGPYKFDAGTATFMYQGVAVGQVSIPKREAGMCSTKKINVAVSLKL